MTRRLHAALLLACMSLPGRAPAQEAEPPEAMGEWEARNWGAYLKQCAEPGVAQRPSGLCYEQLAPGGGPTTLPADSVRTALRETLVDGRVIVDWKADGKLAAFKPAEMVAGLQEALLLMSPGAKMRFYVPPDLGFGYNGNRGGSVPPYSMLTLEVEMLARTRDCGAPQAIDAPVDSGLQSEDDSVPDPRGTTVAHFGMSQLGPALNELFRQRRLKNECLPAGTLYVDLNVEDGRVIDVAAISHNLGDPLFVEQVLDAIRAAPFDMKGLDKPVYYYGYAVNFTR